MKRLTTCGSCTSSSQNLQHVVHNVYRYHGGWLAPNIYYLGNSGCVQVNGVRIGAASGIYKSHHYDLGRFYLISSP